MPFRNVKCSDHDAHNGSYFEEPEPVEEENWKQEHYSAYNIQVLQDLQAAPCAQMNV